MNKKYKILILVIISVLTIGVFTTPSFSANTKNSKAKKAAAVKAKPIKTTPVKTEPIEIIIGEPQEYGVSFVQSEAAAPVQMQEPKTVKKGAFALPFPKDVTIDDELMANRSGRVTYRYNICALGSDLRFINIESKTSDPEKDTKAPKKRIIGTREVRCKYYYGGGDNTSKRKMVNAAIKDFNFYFGVKEVRIAEAKPVYETPVIRFDIDKMKPIKADFDAPSGTIFKKVITDKAKIKKLYGYSYIPLSVKIDELVNARQDEVLPARITVYEQYTPSGVKGTSVIVFNEDEKYLFDLAGLTRGGEIYDIMPDYALQYTPKTAEELEVKQFFSSSRYYFNVWAFAYVQDSRPEKAPKEHYVKLNEKPRTRRPGSIYLASLGLTRKAVVRNPHQPDHTNKNKYQTYGSYCYRFFPFVFATDIYNYVTKEL